MTWNWQTEDWPEWRWDQAAMTEIENAYLLAAGRLGGIWAHLASEDRQAATIGLLSDEALRSSAIEGEVLDRGSVQSSVGRHFGLKPDRRSGPSEAGIAELMSDGFKSWAEPLSDQKLFDWHTMVCNGRVDLKDLGAWRSGGDPMQVVSGPFQASTVHFEAPPAARMTQEMARFIDWFNATAPGKDAAGALPAVTRAGLAHLWFVSVHPFEDGNGRIARALCEKALAQGVGAPSLTALSTRIEQDRKGYYGALETHNKAMEITGWLVWFGKTVLGAQEWSERMIRHILGKTKTLDALGGELNARQLKALLRMCDAGPDGFVGGLSAHNYMTITGAAPATARRDLGELVTLGALRRTGERKGTRYWLVEAELG